MLIAALLYSRHFDGLVYAPTRLCRYVSFVSRPQLSKISLQISDPDSFLMCSNIFVKAKSSNKTLIDYNEMVVGGVFPNCTLRLSPKLYQYGVSQITVELYDFWTTVSTSFTLTVQHVLSPGPFAIIDAEGQDRSVVVTWNPSAYMTGSSARYTVFYRETGAATGFTEITPATSPYTVSGLVNGTSYDFFVRARNSIGTRDTNIVQATPTKFKLRGVEFMAGTNQYENSSPSALVTNVALVTHIDTPDANYPPSSAYPDPTTLAYALPESPVNSPAAPDFGSYLTSPNGNKVYMNSQQNIISGARP